MDRSYLFTSPQKADPLSWIMKFSLPVMFAITTVIATVVILVFAVPAGANPWLIGVSGVLGAAATVQIYRTARPDRRLAGVRDAIMPLLVTFAAVWINIIGWSGSTMPSILWPGPVMVAGVVIALFAYSSAVSLAAYGIIGAAFSGVLAVSYFSGQGSTPLELLVAGAALPLQAGLVAAVSCANMVAGVLRWRALPVDSAQPAESVGQFVARVEEFGAPRSVGPDVVELLAGVAESGMVTARDRERATELGESIRTELVALLDRSWLDAIARERSLVVIDPEHMADRMSAGQRAGIHSLIVSVLESPAVGGERMIIELRSGMDGSTAVAMSVDISLPEGKRVMMLAPYFVSLKSTVDDLEWSGGEKLRMRFKLPAASGGPSQAPPAR